jgi:hypothetical protein
VTGPRGDLNPDVGGLGRKIERPAPAPAPVPHAPGIVRRPDGKLETNIPPPSPRGQP